MIYCRIKTKRVVTHTLARVNNLTADLITNSNFDCNFASSFRNVREVNLPIKEN